MRKLPFALSEQQHADRLKGIGGSDANKIAAGEPAALIALWQEKRREAEPEDLSMVLPVLIGSATEETNRYYYEHTTGREVHGEGRMVVAADYPFMRCSLDGMTTTKNGRPAIFEAKHVNAFGSIEEVVQRYMPQLHHNMHCLAVDWAVLSVIQGTQKYEVFEVESDTLYVADLIEAERKFWACVLDGTAPAAVALTAPVPAEQMIEIDLTGSNVWADGAARWIETRDAAKKFEAAVKDIKSAVPLNAKRAYGHGINVKRSKAGSLTIAMEGA